MLTYCGIMKGYPKVAEKWTSWWRKKNQVMLADMKANSVWRYCLNQLNRTLTGQPAPSCKVQLSPCVNKADSAAAAARRRHVEDVECSCYFRLFWWPAYCILLLCRYCRCLDEFWQLQNQILAISPSPDLLLVSTAVCIVLTLLNATKKAI